MIAVTICVDALYIIDRKKKCSYIRADDFKYANDLFYKKAVKKAIQFKQYLSKNGDMWKNQKFNFTDAFS